MPRTRSLAWSQLKIGLLTIAAIVITSMLIFMVSGEGGFFWQRYRLKARFNDVRGLKSGAPVAVAGVEVGKVSSVQFVGAQVEIVMEISEELQNRITTASRASVGSAGVLGEGVVQITPSTVGEPIPEWGYVATGRATGQIADAVESAARSLDEATALFQDLRRGRGTVGKLLTDDRLYQELDAFVAAAEQVAHRMNRGDGTLGRLLRDPEAYQALEASLRNLNTITDRINAGEGSIGRLLRDDQLAKSFASATDHVDKLAGRINRGEGTVGKLIYDEALYNRLSSVASRLDVLTTRLQDGKGTAGQLLQDGALYENMNQAVAELRGLVADIRKDPKKYLAVKVSIF